MPTPSPRMPADYSSIVRASEIIRNGGLVVFPTDTVYGLGCNPRNSEAVERLFRAKKREAKPIPILCDCLGTAASVVDLSGPAERLAKAFWPGALTIVAPARIEFPRAIHQGSRMVGVRVPAHELSLRLIRDSGGTITGTSANLSGHAPCRSAEQAISELGAAVDLVLDGGYLSGRESTVVRLDGERIEVLREGGVRVTDKVAYK